MLSKTALDEHNFRRIMRFANSAREGWDMILKTLNPNDEVLLPAYIGITEREGSGIYDPILNNNIKHDFYLLNHDLTISIIELKRILSEQSYKMILLVHYFGFQIPNLKEILDLCKSYNVLVVEDCAHLYNFNASNFSDVGTLGDYAFYSLHKFFPMKSGGICVQNNPTKKIKENPIIKLDENYAQKILEFDVQEIINKRIENYHLLEQLLSQLSGVTPLRKWNKGDIPHNYPILVESGLREKLYFWLIENNVTLIALYYRLIEPLHDPKYKQMQELSDAILNLPIHQDVSKEDLINLVDLIKRGLKELGNDK